MIEERFTNWQGQDFDEDTLEPSELTEALMEYLDCECTYFPSMKDDDPIMSAYSYAKRESVKEGFVPVLIKADDETLLECLVMNADPKNDADIYEFDLKTVTEYRKKMLSAPIKDSKAVLEDLIGQLKPDVISIEELFFSKNITTGIAVAHGRGVILCTAEKLGVPICEYTPMQVKQAVVGYGLAEKKQVMDMTRRLLHLKTVPKPDDAADALAIAICHARSATSLLRHKDPNVKETV